MDILLRFLVIESLGEAMDSRPGDLVCELLNC